MSISYKTPAYFSGFSCLGGDCEDTCCRNWEVKLDREHYDLLKKAVFNDEFTSSDFQRNVYLNEKPITSDHDYAFIRMGENGYCTMLDENGLCSIHAKYGITTLCNVCTIFPRIISRCANTIELTGALSCPEVVRSCISDDAPLKLKRFKPADLPRGKKYPVQRELSVLDDDYYSESFDLVRKNMMQIMANEEHCFETRLYVLANFAHKISTFYHRGCVKPSHGQLESLVVSLTENEFVSKLGLFIKSYEVDSPISMIVVHSILSIKLQQSHDENISQIYQSIIEKIDVNDENIAEVLAEQLRKNRANLSDECRDYIDSALTRYILNCLYREWFVSMPDPFTYVQMLLVRTAILRTLIYLDINSETEIDKNKLNERIVYIMYNFARNVDQNLEFLKIIFNALSEQTMINFDFSPAFIRID